MNCEDVVSEKRTKNVRKRFEITEDQDKRLLDIEQRMKIPPSAIVRLALECFFPKTTNYGFTDEGIKRLWNENKF